MASHEDSAGRWYADTGQVLIPLNPAGDEIRRQERLTLDQRLRAEYDAETARQVTDG
jgi:hypothetical protein